MRIVTRPDFDGVVCAALLFESEAITYPTCWVEPGDMQHGRISIAPYDIIANLPFVKGCAMWFDHHYTNRPEGPFKGLFRIAPSAACLVYEYYREKMSRDFDELIAHTNDIDAANLTLDQVKQPENDPYLLLSMTISSREKTDTPYWDHLVQLLRKEPVDRVMADPEVTQRCQRTIAANRDFETLLLQHTRLNGRVAVADFRPFKKAPEGNRFLVYSLFPEAVVAVKIRTAHDDPEKIIVSVGHSIFNRQCRVNVGDMLSRFGGGGHVGAGAASFHIGNSDDYIPRILDILEKNEPDNHSRV